MKNQLKKEIKNFKEWSFNLMKIAEPERGGEWEEDYEKWGLIYELFYEFISETVYSDWEIGDIKDILYLIARNNEMEDFISEIVDKQIESLELLALKSFEFGEWDSKWQIAINLDKLPNKEKAKILLERFLKDENEYVRRRALMTIAKLDHPKIEEFCEEAWNRKDEWQEYQRIAVLHSLHLVNSVHIKRYFQKAEEDGREYLILNLNKLKNIKNEV